ncbi:MAG: hypothetical protein KC656_05200 [Myxococcales bacterium]|nr:hypothetical protein [Myxococcales bacterium]
MSTRWTQRSRWLLFPLLLTGCPWLQEPDPTEPTDDPELTRAGVVMGTVVDPSGYGLGSVVVSVGDLSTTTNSQGYFVLDEVDPTERAVVRFDQDGFVSTAEIVRVRGGESTWLDEVLTPHGIVQTVDSASGGTVTTSEGASVTLPAGFAVGPNGTAWTGPVDVAVTLFDPSTDAGLASFPGEFWGTRTDSTETLLISYGFMDVSLFDPATGDRLDSASGASFDLVVPVPAAMEADAPATIPLWWFDPAAGEWLEQSTATFDGTRYTGSVPHLSIWNCDVAADRSYVVGRVVDCDGGGDPVMGARVTVKGQRGWTSGETSTPSDGTFRIPVDSDHSCTLWPSKNGEEGEQVAFTSAGTNGEVDVGDVCLGVPPVKVTLTWNAQPQDLDSHLTAPGDPREHLYYGTDSISHAALDTDDTDGFGPEIITFYDLRDGIYRYAVHHYSGSSDMSTEGATALMIVDGVGIYRANPPAGGQGVDDVWQVWDLTVSDGQVEAVTPLNTIVRSMGSTDMDAFDP